MIQHAGQEVGDAERGGVGGQKRLAGWVGKATPRGFRDHQKTFRPCQPDQVLRLPPTHAVYFLEDVVSQVDIAGT